MKHALLLSFAACSLSACSPGEIADKALARAAETVILPVVDDTLTQSQARGVTSCIIENAQISEVQALARDIGTVAGTSTIATITGIATRPATLACIAAKGLPQPGFQT